MKTGIKLTSYNHTVGESNCHLQFTPKYRKPIFEDKNVLAECEKQFKEIAARLNVQLVGMGLGPDHAHIFVANWKNYSIAELAQRFKGASARVIRQKLPVRLTVKGLYGDSMWSDGYFHRTVGAVTSETIKKYVNESQKKHWTTHKQVQAQTTLLNCN